MLCSGKKSTGNRMAEQKPISRNSIVFARGKNDPDHVAIATPCDCARQIILSWATLMLAPPWVGMEEWKVVVQGRPSSFSAGLYVESSFLWRHILRTG